MNETYLECLAEISLKKYQEIVSYSVKLEARVAELSKKINELSEENQTLNRKLEAKTKRATTTNKSNG